MLSAHCDLQTNLNKQNQLQETFPNSSFVPDLSKQSKCSELYLRHFSVKVSFYELETETVNKHYPIFTNSQINTQLELLPKPT